MKSITKIFLNKSNYKRSYSQDGEDMLIMSLYQGIPNHYGFYVDIGAHDPIRFSNTQYFYEKGWRGINIDATPDSMKNFNILRPEDINLEYAISDKEENLYYYCFEEPALNSFDDALSEERIKNGWKLKEKIVLNTQSINSILKKYLPPNKQIDFINIDVEGLELRILKTFNYDKYAPKYFLIEDLENRQANLFNIQCSELSNLMKEKGYYPILKSLRTIVYARNP